MFIIKGINLTQVNKIKGPNIVVTVNETKLGKRKYNRNHYVKSIWCIFVIERTKERRCFVVPIENKNSKIILTILKKYVLPQITVYTNCGKVYIKQFKRLMLENCTVNYSKKV